MKTMYVSDNTNIVVDLDTQALSHMDSKREGISRIYLIPEDMKVIVKKGENTIELNAEKDDLLITFYENTFSNPAIIVKNSEWVKNINEYDAEMQAQRERWAAEKAATSAKMVADDDEGPSETAELASF